MILDSERIDLSQEERSALSRAIDPYEELVAVAAAKLELVASEWTARVKIGRQATPLEAAALALVRGKEFASAQDIGAAVGFEEPGSPLPELLFERLLSAGLLQGDRSAAYMSAAGAESAESGLIYEDLARDFTLALAPPEATGGKEMVIDRSLAPALLKRSDWTRHSRFDAFDRQYLLASVHAQRPDLHSPSSGVRIDPESIAAKRLGVVELEQRCALVRSRSEGGCRLVPIVTERNAARRELLAALAAGAEEEARRILAEHAASQEDQGGATEPEAGRNELDELAAMIGAAERSGEDEKAAYFRGMFESLKLSRFGTLAFEDELMRLFARAESIFVASPFIRDRAFGARAPLIENALRRKATVVVVASLPEGPGRPNVDPGARKRLERWQEKERRFVFAELPAFHYKRLFAFGPEDCQYEGSFNVLSFKGAEGSGLVREESMVKLPWSEETEVQFEAMRAAIVAALTPAYEEAASKLAALMTRKDSVLDRELNTTVETLSQKLKLIRDFPLPGKKGIA